jgi:hypothetical protein
MSWRSQWISGTNQGQGVGLSNGFALDRVYADVMKQPEFVEEVVGVLLGKHMN